MSDLIERLYKAAMIQWQNQSGQSDISTFMEHEAAAEIERLRGVLENIRDHAISNGEDCAYLDASEALKETE